MTPPIFKEGMRQLRVRSCATEPSLPRRLPLALTARLPPADAGWPMSGTAELPFDERRDPATRQTASGVPVGVPSEGTPASKDAKIFRDGEGVTWWAHEVAGEHLGTVGATCLLVVSANELRRIWRYPAEWRQLSPAELLALPQHPAQGRAGPNW